MTEFGATSGTMDLTNDVEPVTSLKRSAAELIARATDRHSPIVITQNGRPTAVLQDVHSYERLTRTRPFTTQRARPRAPLTPTASSSAQPAGQT